jgi:hypothetical protein
VASSDWWCDNNAFAYAGGNAYHRDSCSRDPVCDTSVGNLECVLQPEVRDNAVELYTEEASTTVLALGSLMHDMYDLTRVVL